MVSTNGNGGELLSTQIRLDVARTNLRRAVQQLAEDYPEAASLAEDVHADAEALADVVDAIEEGNDRWEGSLAEAMTE